MSRWTRLIAVVVFAAPTFSLTATAHAQTLYTETFETAPINTPFSGTITNTGLAMTSGFTYVRATDPTPGRGNFLQLPTGIYQSFQDPSVSVSSATTFDLLAGRVYSLTFDWSRSPGGGGNGPFNVSLTASIGSQNVTYNDVAGFYYDFDWSAGILSWTQASDAFGTKINLFATGELYSGMLVDNLTLADVTRADPPPTNTVPEPSTYVLMASGLLGLHGLSRRRKRS